MLAGLKKRWRGFQRAEPSHRFRDFHERQRRGFARTWWGRLLCVIAGLACLVIGGFFAVFPGPAFVFLIPGAVLLSSQSRTTARALDWLDVRLAPVIAFAWQRWRRLPGRTRRWLTVASACSAIAGLVAAVILAIR